MKTSFGFISAAIASALLVSTLVIATANAGPGEAAWQSLRSTKADVVKRAACRGSDVVPVITNQPSWQNGRGPLAEVQIGNERICRVCPVTNTTTTNWENGRGPAATKSAITPAGTPHRCGSGCAAAPSVAAN